MSATGNLDQTHWQDLFENRARVRFPEKIEQALAKPEVFSQVTNVPQLATLVRGALVARDKVNAAPLADLVQLSLDTMLIVGAGPGFTEYDEFFASALQLVDEVEAREYPVSQLLLSAARFQALLATGDARRRQLIERAVTTSQGPAERLPALLTLAKFWIDVSKYPAARRALAECEELLANGTHTQFEADFETTVGVSYFYTEPDTAQKHFQESVRLGRRRTHEPGIGQAVATALHFLGRLAANRGDYRHAIELYTEAEELSDDYLTGHGFYHQRIAEILVDHGRLDEARYHLERGSEAFAKIQQVSIGLALLDGVWARLYNRQGELVKAEETLRKALHLSRAHNGPRAELMLLVQLARLRLRRRRLGSVMPIVIRGGWLYLRTEASGGALEMLRQTKTGMRMATGLLRSSSERKGRFNAVDPILCSCGADHMAARKGPAMAASARVE